MLSTQSKLYTHGELGKIHQRIAVLTDTIRRIESSLHTARDERDQMIKKSVEIQKYFAMEEGKVEVFSPSRSSKSKGKARVTSAKKPTGTKVSDSDILAYIKLHGKDAILKMLDGKK